MAKLVPNKKGFKVLVISQEEARKAHWGIDEYGTCLCSQCNRPIEGPIYFPAVLADTMDKECFEEWIERATNYPEDRPMEKSILESYLKQFTLEEDLTNKY